MTINRLRSMIRPRNHSVPIPHGTLGGEGAPAYLIILARLKQHTHTHCCATAGVAAWWRMTGELRLINSTRLRIFCFTMTVIWLTGVNSQINWRSNSGSEHTNFQPLRCGMLRIQRPPQKSLTHTTYAMYTTQAWTQISHRQQLICKKRAALRSKWYKPVVGTSILSADRSLS